MNQPFRLKPVLVVLDMYRTAVVAIGDALAVAGPVIRDISLRAAERVTLTARRIARPSGEMMPALIGARVRAARPR